jgi:hypothetical protein
MIDIRANSLENHINPGKKKKMATPYCSHPPLSPIGWAMITPSNPRNK